MSVLGSIGFAVLSDNLDPFVVPVPHFGDLYAKAFVSFFSIVRFPKLRMPVHRELIESLFLHHLYDIARSMFGPFCFFDNRVLLVDVRCQLCIRLNKLNDLIGSALSICGLRYKENPIRESRAVEFLIG